MRTHDIVTHFQGLRLPASPCNPAALTRRHLLNSAVLISSFFSLLKPATSLISWHCSCLYTKSFRIFFFFLISVSCPLISTCTLRVCLRPTFLRFPIRPSQHTSCNLSGFFSWRAGCLIFMISWSHCADVAEPTESKSCVEKWTDNFSHSCSAEGYWDFVVTRRAWTEHLRGILLAIQKYPTSNPLASFIGLRWPCVGLPVVSGASNSTSASLRMEPLTIRLLAPFNLCSCSVTACPLKSLKHNKAPSSQVQFSTVLVSSSITSLLPKGLPSTETGGCALPLDLRGPLPHAWLLLPCLWLGQHLFPTPCWTPGWHQLQALCWLPAESLIRSLFLCCCCKPWKYICSSYAPLFCPASYLPPTPTVSTGASLRPSAWGPGAPYTRQSSTDPRLLSCCLGLSSTGWVEGGEGILVYNCTFGFDFDWNFTHGNAFGEFKRCKKYFNTLLLEF